MILDLTTRSRNQRIRERGEAGATVGDIAEEFFLSKNRVRQILSTEDHEGYPTICDVCGAFFITEFPNKRRCSAACAKRAEDHLRRSKYSERNATSPLPIGRVNDRMPINDRIDIHRDSFLNSRHVNIAVQGSCLTDFVLIVSSQEPDAAYQVQTKMTQGDVKALRDLLDRALTETSIAE